jgi:hypothetical protein
LAISSPSVCGRSSKMMAEALVDMARIVPGLRSGSN